MSTKILILHSFTVAICATNPQFPSIAIQSSMQSSVWLMFAFDQEIVMQTSLALSELNMRRDWLGLVSNTT